AFSVPVPHRVLPPFPTRRSSDLSFSEKGATAVVDMVVGPACLCPDVPRGLHQAADEQQPDQRDGNEDLPAQAHDLVVAEPGEGRSEEHTSELQSRENLVCRLLLE